MSNGQKYGTCCLAMAGKRFRIDDVQLRAMAHMLNYYGYPVTRWSETKFVARINGRVLLVTKDGELYKFSYVESRLRVSWEFESKSLPFLIRSYFVNKIEDFAFHKEFFE